MSLHSVQAPPAPPPSGRGAAAPGATTTEILHRAAKVGKIDADARTVELSFSSEIPVERSFGREILDHSDGSIRLDWIASGRAPLLMDHSMRDQIGVVERVWIGADKRGRALVRFGRSPRASEMLQDVADGIRTNISVGYRLYRVVLEEEGDGGPIYRATDWEPYEISLVSYPADPSVGIGRAAAERPNQHQTIIETRGNSMSESFQSSELMTGADGERQRVANILGVADRMPHLPNIATMAREFIAEGRTLAEFQSRVIELAGGQSRSSVIRPSSFTPSTFGGREGYSLSRAIGAMLNRTGSPELELSQDLARQVGRAPRGIYVPTSAVLGRSAMNTGAFDAGGSLVGTEHMYGEYVDALRPVARSIELGARLLPGLTQQVSIPKLASGVTAEWVAEGVAPASSSTLTTGGLELRGRECAALLEYTTKLLKQSAPWIETLVKADMRAQLGLALDKAIIAGDGALEPLGLLKQPGVSLVSLGTDGGPPTWERIVAMTANVEHDNGLGNAPAFLTNALVKARLMTTAKEEGFPQYILSEPGDRLAGYRFATSSQVPSNGTKGAGNGLSSLIFGDFSQILIGEFGVIDITVDDVTKADAGRVRIIARMLVDVAVRHPESFAVIKDMVTTA